MRIVTSILVLIQALNAGAAIPEAVYEDIYPITPYPNITITVWTDNNCGKRDAQGRVDLHSYDRERQSLLMDANTNNEIISLLTGSYWLSRDLINNERLDWSACSGTGDCSGTTSIPGECMRFIQRTSPDSNGNALLMHTCYLLDPGATVSHIAREERLGWYILVCVSSARISGTLRTAHLI